MTVMTRRLVVFRSVMAIFFTLILLRLLQLQVIEGRSNRQFAEQNRLRLLPRTAPRGTIYDRRGRVLASVQLAFSVHVVPEELRAVGSSDATGTLAQLVSLPRERVRQQLGQGEGRPAEVILLSRADPQVVARLAEHSLYLTGVSVVAGPVRHYPYGALGAHALGYVREISPADLVHLEGRDRKAGDLVGKQGVENMLDSCLRGVDGGDRIEVDATGRTIRTLGAVSPHAGSNITVTLDLDLQRAAEQALGDHTGAVVAMDAHTGEVLALASHPAFDPNLFTRALSRREWERLNGPDRPQHNRATAGLYPPGSVFKIVTAAAALETGTSRPDTRVYCPGSISLGDWKLQCWKRDGHGAISFTQGFGQSCNVMFASLGRQVGADKLAGMARRFGLGDRTGIDLPEESHGLIPTERWKRAHHHQPWYPGDTCQMAIGQGDVLVTPLQVAREVALVANGGYLVQPHLLLGIQGSKEPPRWLKRQAGLRAETIAALQRGLAAVVGEGGTAHAIASPTYGIAGKTGTAEAPTGAPHAWFAGYAPLDDPQIVVVVLVEHGGHGGTVAAPIARTIFDAALLPARQLTSVSMLEDGQ